MQSVNSGRRVDAVWLRWLWVVVAVAGVVGCSSTARQLRLAQDAFNQGAALENEARLGKLFHPIQVGAIPAPEELSPDVYYRAALAELDGVSEPQLKQDGLLVTKLTIEALCRWKLDESAMANAIALRAKAMASHTDTPRDDVILTLLPGLIKNDQAYAEYTAPDAKAETLPSVEKSLFGPQGAVVHVEAARQLAKGRPIEVYVLQVYLSLYKNLMEAKVNLQRETLTRGEKDAVAALQTELGEAMSAHGLSSDQRSAWLALWRTAIPTP